MNTRIDRRVVLALGAIAALSVVSTRAEPPKPSAAFSDSPIAETAEQKAALRERIGRVTRDELTALCAQLVTPGAGDDTHARMLLHGVAQYCTTPAETRVRAEFIAAVGAALEKKPPADVQSFLAEQLAVCGDASAVPVLAPLLAAQETALPALAALTAIGGADAAAAVRSAHPALQGRARIGAILAEGRLRDAAATDLLLVDAGAQDDAVRRAARAALAEIGALQAVDLLRAALKEGNRLDRGIAADNLLTLARRQAENGQATVAARLYRDLLQPEVAVAARAAALHGLARSAGAAAIDEVVSALQSDDAILRTAAAEAAFGLSGAPATEALVGQLERAAPALRVTLLDILARRGDAQALPAVARRLGDGEPDARIAAIRAVAQLGGVDALDTLVPMLAASNPPEREAAVAALAGLSDAQADARLVQAIPDALPAARAGIIEVLARRRASAQVPILLRLTGDPESVVRVAAILAVGELGDYESARALLSLLDEPAGRDEVRAVEMAVAALCARIPDERRRAEPVLERLNPAAGDYEALLRILGKLGGAPAWTSVKPATQDSRDGPREAAFAALSEWPDALPLADALDLARASSDLRYHVLALRGYTRMIGLAEHLPAAERVQYCRAGLAAARRPEEKRLILARLGEIPDPAAAAALEQLLADADLRSEAGAALVNIADRLLPRGWAESRRILTALSAAELPDPVRARATEVRGRVTEVEDFILDWEVAGPYLERGKDMKAVHETAYPPEQPDARDVTWQRQPVADDSVWFVDLNALFAGPERAAYLRTYVYSPVAQDVRLEAGSDDAMKLWLNGKLVREWLGVRGVSKADEKIAARLSAGWNTVLFKVTNGSGGWAASLRVRSPDGKHLDGVVHAASPPADHKPNGVK